jgi:hypothetical protein
MHELSLSRLVPLVLALAALTASCNHAPPPAGHPLVRDACLEQAAGVLCVGAELHDCDGAGHSSRITDCSVSGLTCVPSRGCMTCAPEQFACDGETVRLCNAEGTELTVGPTCDPTIGEHCSRESCQDLCARAVETHSYIGCEYFPTVLPNSQLDPAFTFAVVIANPQLVEAQVTIARGADVLDQLIVPPGGLEVRELPWVDALRGTPGFPASVVVPSGAYHLTSDVPVTVTQFNPLRFQRADGCTGRECFSFTNGASLLLPAHVLTGSYLAMSRPTHILTSADGGYSGPGYVAIVNVEEHEISVNVRPRSFTRASLDETVPALMPGEEHEFILAAGDVLLLESDAPLGACPGETSSDDVGGAHFDYCNPGPEFDLTGTEIKSNARVAVFSGHDCTFIPYDRWACDHLEQQIFPVESLGRELFVPITEPLRDDEPNLLRVVSAHSPTHVRFDPPLDDGTESVDLDRGDWFESEIRHDLWVHADGAVLGAIFLVGQDYSGFGSSGSFAVGDPGMSLVVPTEQYRQTYTFLAPDTYLRSYIDVAIPQGSQIFLDDRPITPDLEDSVNGMRVARLRISTGAHAIRGERPFGLYVYGFGTYTSYLVPGGMDFIPITPPF